MFSVVINNKSICSLKPRKKPYYVRDITIKGFGMRVYPSGRLVFISEVWHEGKSYRRTLGPYPALQPQQARNSALSYIATVKSGCSMTKSKAKMDSLRRLFEKYVASGRLKERTVIDYTEAIFFYLSDWMEKPVASITKPMVEKRFIQIRDKGINGGRPTYSQATKTMRILSALMNYARADELIGSNPVEVLKFKRIDRSIRKREHYLPADKARELLSVSAQDGHPVTLAVHLMLYSGLRKAR